MATLVLHAALPEVLNKGKPSLSFIFFPNGHHFGCTTFANWGSCTLAKMHTLTLSRAQS